MKPIIVLGLFLLSITTAIAQPQPAFQLEEATIDSIQEAFKTHQITCVGLVTAYLDRIKQYNLNLDHKKPPINAITEINPEVLHEAQRLDKEYQHSKKLTGRLHCIPIILKDNIDAIGTTTSAGSLALLGTRPHHDAPLVAELRKAGAIIIAKGAMDEFGFGMFGISSRNGRVGNVYDTRKNPGGSSSGVAAAISANFAVIGIGTDNTGSVRVPAAFNGVVGLRPTSGLISQQGIFPIGNIDATAGLITRNAKDLAAVLEVLAPGKAYTASNKAFEGKRIGMVRRVASIDIYRDMPLPVQMQLQAAYKRMHDYGAQIVEVNLPDFDRNQKFNHAGEIEDINHYLSTVTSPRKKFIDICQSQKTTNFGSVDTCIQYLKLNPGKASRFYREALERIEKNRAYVESAMRAQQVDVLLVPISTEGVPTYNPDHINSWQAPIASNAGLPAIAFPVAYLFGQPIGIELIGKANQEAEILALAEAFESDFHVRLLPRLASSSDLKEMSIAELNHLFTRLGVVTFEQILKNMPLEEPWDHALTPEIFQNIVSKEIHDQITIR